MPPPNSLQTLFYFESYYQEIEKLTQSLTDLDKKKQELQKLQTEQIQLKGQILRLQEIIISKNRLRDLSSSNWKTFLDQSKLTGLTKKDGLLLENFICNLPKNHIQEITEITNKIIDQKEFQVTINKITTIKIDQITTDKSLIESIDIANTYKLAEIIRSIDKINTEIQQYLTKNYQPFVRFISFFTGIFLWPFGKKAWRQSDIEKYDAINQHANKYLPPLINSQLYKNRHVISNTLVQLALNNETAHLSQLNEPIQSKQAILDELSIKIKILKIEIRYKEEKINIQKAQINAFNTSIENNPKNSKHIAAHSIS